MKGKKTLTICQQLFVCKYCFNFVNMSALKKKGVRRHSCKKNWCAVCKCYTTEHFCTIQKYMKEMPEKFTLIFFDIETIQQKEIQDKDGKIQFEHEAILLITQTVCEKCWNKSEDFVCSHEKEKIYEGSDCLFDFLTFLYKYQPNKSIVTCLSHNSKSFDGVLILNAALRLKNCNFSNIHLITSGFKLLRIQLNKKISFIDSLMFLPMPLAKFQETFDLNPTLTKGFFPYLFSTFDNWNYKGQIPEKRYFNMEVSTKNRQKEFDLWYEKKSKEEYNLRNEAILYCSNDVTLLRLGCLKFMEGIIEIANINPFVECFTLAQLALLIYRKSFMPTNKLGIVPRNNYHSGTIQSKICRKWLAFLNYFQPSSENYFIEPEVVLKECNLHVDGFCEGGYPFRPKNKMGTVFEFSGCYFHGCKKCFQTNPYNLKHATDMAGNKLQQKGVFAKQKYYATLSKLDRIKELGYDVVHIWEHEFVDFLKENPKLNEELSKHEFVNFSNLDARSAIYGGRTEASRVYYKAKPGEKIRFYDFCSLYSFSMLNTKYFIKHPRQILSFKQCERLNIDDLKKMNGLAYREVLPNQNLFFPILPYRSEGKLKFPSCRSCVESLNPVCNHEKESERSLIGTWSIDELKAAFEYGYKLIRIFEVWDYEYESGKQNAKLDSIENLTYETLLKSVEDKQKDQNTPGFFTEYTYTFIRLKAEASGFPNWCQNDEDKKRYIIDFYKENNVLLRWSQIKYNATLRALAKLMLNALYGKLIQQEKFISTSILSHPCDLKFYLNSNVHQILDLYCCNENYLVITWKLVQVNENEEIELNPGFRRVEQKNVCLTTGIQTTTGARLHLYSEMSKLNSRLLYTDTDSLIFISSENKNEYNPTLSNAVGGLSSELERHRKRPDFEPYICEFVCLAPKTYALCIVCEPIDSPNFKYIYEIKAKGLTLTGENAKKINMNLMKSFVLGENLIGHKEDSFYFDSFQTKRQCIRTLKNFKIVTQEQTRALKFTFDKRAVHDDFITYPYGYKE